MQRVNRITPAIGPGHYKTYEIAVPRATHWRSATCAEVDCRPYQYGWVTRVLPGSQDEAAVRASGRSFTAEQAEGGFLQFVFPPGQPCFRASVHQLPLERPPLYVVRDGDWRGNPTGQVRQHVNGDDWVDDFATHQQNIADVRERG